jgi:hypothetical protein
MDMTSCRVAWTIQKKHPSTIIDSWHYDWGATKAREDANTRVVQLLGYPDEFVWDGEWGNSKRDLEEAERRRAKPSDTAEDNAVELLVELGLENTTVSAKRGNTARKIHEENAGLADGDCARETGQRTYTRTFVSAEDNRAMIQRQQQRGKCREIPERSDCSTSSNTL